MLDVMKEIKQGVPNMIHSFHLYVILISTFDPCNAQMSTSQLVQMTSIIVH